MRPVEYTADYADIADATGTLSAEGTLIALVLLGALLVCALRWPMETVLAVMVAGALFVVATQGAAGLVWGLGFLAYLALVMRLCAR